MAHPLAPELSEALLSEEDLGYFFAFASFPGPWPLDGFVSELGEDEAFHERKLEQLQERGLAEKVNKGWQPSKGGQRLFDASQEAIGVGSSLEGAKTLAEAASRLRCEADRLEALEGEGWQLVDEIQDDCGQLLRTREQLESQVPLEPLEEGLRGRLSGLAEAAVR